MDTSLKRKELINWLQKIDDVKLLLQIEKIKIKYTSVDNESYLSLDEAKRISLSKIEEWPKK